MKKRLISAFLAVVLVCGMSSCDILEEEGAVETAPAVDPVTPTANVKVNLADLYLNWQYRFADAFDIPLEKFDEQKAVAQWMTEARTGEAQRVYESSSLFSEEKQYKLTASSGDYLYYGETKNNYPDGLGMLLRGSTIEDLEDIRYIGYFSEGRFDGYGLLFAEPDSNDSAAFATMKSNGLVSADGVSDQYHGFVNYVTYEGEFDQGEASGQGNDFYCWLSLMLGVPGVVDDGFHPEVIPFVVKVGKFKSGQANGEVLEYSVDGSLYYKGKQKDDKPDGSGTLYFSDGTVKYEGEFKDGQYHGKGTLYDEQGNVVYDGKWSYGDYA